MSSSFFIKYALLRGKRDMKTGYFFFHIEMSDVIKQFGLEFMDIKMAMIRYLFLTMYSIVFR
jgi:hypothetical protein